MAKSFHKLETVVALFALGVTSSILDHVVDSDVDYVLKYNGIYFKSQRVVPTAENSFPVDSREHSINKR